LSNFGQQSLPIWHTLSSRIELRDETFGRRPTSFGRLTQFWRNIMDRTWSVEIEGKKHRIEVDYGRNDSRTGKLMIDGDELKTWKNSQWLDVPKEIAFEVGGKPAVLREKGLFTARINLFLEGKLIKQA
jgi:hypothetical protein